MLPGVFLAIVAWNATPKWLSDVGLSLALALIALGSRVGALTATIQMAKQIPENGWGVCSGMTEQSGGTAPALVPWLAAYLDNLAGKPDGKPLTFGDLENRGIDLQMITTNLTNGKPYSMPFGAHTHFYYKPQELKKLFPEYVVPVDGFAPRYSLIAGPEWRGADSEG